MPEENNYKWETTEFKVLVIAAKKKLFPLKKYQNISIPFQQFFFHICELLRHLNLASNFKNNKKLLHQSVEKGYILMYMSHGQVSDLQDKSQAKTWTKYALIGGND